ncbi:splicing arginine serine-rich protein [Cyclospora cayetanensis]|uniref:Splicing arginine serine-rich protein n=1 Tax=Cyclospora cayetanensis TaxID=88456 RepID=A0A1D3CR87_9EIME|nr:splicing arginine serine-rich protein [Cyclospora cayetanensis]
MRRQQLIRNAIRSGSAVAAAARRVRPFTEQSQGALHLQQQQPHPEGCTSTNSDSRIALFILGKRHSNQKGLPPSKSRTAASGKASLSLSTSVRGGKTPPLRDKPPCDSRLIKIDVEGEEVLVDRYDVRLLLGNIGPFIHQNCSEERRLTALQETREIEEMRYEVMTPESMPSTHVPPSPIAVPLLLHPEGPDYTAVPPPEALDQSDNAPDLPAELRLPENLREYLVVERTAHFVREKRPPPSPPPSRHPADAKAGQCLTSATATAEADLLLSALLPPPPAAKEASDAAPSPARPDEEGGHAGEDEGDDSGEEEGTSNSSSSNPKDLTAIWRSLRLTRFSLKKPKRGAGPSTERDVQMDAEDIDAMMEALPQKPPWALPNAKLGLSKYEDDASTFPFLRPSSMDLRYFRYVLKCVEAEIQKEGFVKPQPLPGPTHNFARSFLARLQLNHHLQQRKQQLLLECRRLSEKTPETPGMGAESGVSRDGCAAAGVVAADGSS